MASTMYTQARCNARLFVTAQFPAATGKKCDDMIERNVERFFENEVKKLGSKTVYKQSSRERQIYRDALTMLSSKARERVEKAYGS